MRRYAEQVDHTRDVITTLESISNHFKSAQIYTPNYPQSQNNDFYKLYKAEADSIDNELFYLQDLVKDNPGQTKLVDSINVSIKGQIPTLMQKNIAEIIADGEAWRLNYLFYTHNLINRAIKVERELLDIRKYELQSSTRLTNILTTVFAIIAVAIILFTFISTIFLSKKRNWLEGFLESILNTSQNGVVHYKAVREEGKIVDFKLEFVNKAIEHLLGIKIDDVLGKNLSEFPSYVRDTELFEKYIQVTVTGNPAEFETLYKKDKIERWFLVSLSKMDDGVIASFHDISQLKKYEEDLKNNIVELERSNNELEQYAYVASHDLQEPLRKIRSFGSYLQETQGEKLDAKGRQQLDKIMSSAERMSVLIKDILSFSSLKKQDLFESTDLNKTLETVLHDLELNITQKEAEVISDDLPFIESIPLQMNQLFYNLINNALKFARQNIKPVIRITCRRLSIREKKDFGLADAIYYEIIFADNGIGFNQEYADQIFGLFKRLNDKQYYPGSGIGLSLCKKVVENHKGIIYARGTENEGASFYIILPEKQN